MGQLFNRIKDYIKSELNHNDLDSNYNYDELSHIIEELNKSNKVSEKSDQFQSNHTKAKVENEKMNLQKACEILEIPLDADWETIQNSYRRLIKEYHPDKVNNMGKEIRKLAEQKTIEINQAYDYIKNIKNIK